RTSCPVGQAEHGLKQGSAPPTVATDNAAESVSVAAAQVVRGGPVPPLMALDREAYLADLGIDRGRFGIDNHRGKWPGKPVVRRDEVEHEVACSRILGQVEEVFGELGRQRLVPESA